MPVVRGTVWRCLRNLLQGSMRHLPLVRRTLLRVSWPLLALLFDLCFSRREVFNLHYPQAFKAKLSTPVTCFGGFLTRAAMEATLVRGSCANVCAGRECCAQPHCDRPPRGP